MIGEQSKVKQFCNSDISLIENYDKAINSDIWYVCHHKLGIELDKSSKELIKLDLYYNRPPEELIFLTRQEHTQIHSTTDKRRKRSSESMAIYNKSDKHRYAATESNKRRWKDGCPEDTRQKIRDSREKFYNEYNIIGINKNDVIKMIDINELENYLSEGWNRGYGRPSWNSKKNISNII